MSGSRKNRGNVRKGNVATLCLTNATPAVRNRLIRRGEKVTLWWASANRDDTYYEQPFAFDIGRQKNLHMAFGSGGHSCLGSQLARLEMRVILLHLLDQVDGFRLEGDVNWVRSNKHTGIRSMLVRFLKRY
ncbi:TPA: cytochrome P450 [Salmonella enterica]